MSKTTNKSLHELEEQQEALERELLIENSKTAVKVPESIIREYYDEALRLEAPMIINMLVKEIVLHNERIEIYFNSPIKNCPDESQGFSFSCVDGDEKGRGSETVRWTVRAAADRRAQFARRVESPEVFSTK